MKRFMILSILLQITMVACEEATPFRPGNRQAQVQIDWLIPVYQVVDGGPGKDGIPALEKPEKWLLEDPRNDYLKDTSLVLAYSDGDLYCAYPHDVLDWHEIINDEVGEHWIAVTYCPLTGTGIGWERILQEEITTFGVSGLLYNANLIPYDRKTGSNWSQIRMDCVNGELQGTKAKILQMVEITWEAWQEMYPETPIVSTNTGHMRSYGKYPYGNYRQNPHLVFKVQPEDDRLHPKERVLGVIEQGSMKAYRFSSFGDSVSLIQDKFRGKDIIIAGKNKAFMTAFYPEVTPGTFLALRPLDGDGGVIMEDHEGNRWDVFGRAVSGPRSGERLDQPVSFMGYWFAMAAFYPSPQIY